MRYYATAEQRLVKQQIKQRILSSQGSSKGHKTQRRPRYPPTLPRPAHTPTPHHGQKGDHREKSPEILVWIGSGGNNKCEKGILEQKYKDNSHEISSFWLIFANCKSAANYTANS